MQTPINPFKQALKAHRPQIGLWLGLANATTTEICAGAGFDWLVLDGEHAPNDLASILAQLQVLLAYPQTHAVARVPVGLGHVGTANIKQYLDLGAQTILVPMIDTAEQAAAVVQAMRYPQDDGRGGIRGAAGARGSRWGRFEHYYHEANEQVCLLVQAESKTALENIEAIAAVDGVDGIFIGPADLAGSMGHVGGLTHPAVRAAIDDAIVRIVGCGKAAGILTINHELARHYLALGASFVAVGLDHQLLVQSTNALAAQFKSANI